MLFTLHDFSDEKTLYLTPEQEKDKSHFTDKEVSTTKKGQVPVMSKLPTHNSTCS